MQNTAPVDIQTKKGRIIVVDDEENIRTTLQQILSDEGYHVSCASDGESALRIMKSEAPDLVLLDVWIPGLDGMQTLKMLKNIDPKTEVVMMSGHGTIDTAVKATKFGAFDYIEKPFSLDFILLTVAKALKNRRTGMARGKHPALARSVIIDRQLTGSSAKTKKLRRMIKNTSENHKPVLIYGETGLGKKFVARLIHDLSTRRDKPFIEISSEAITTEMIDSLTPSVDKKRASGLRGTKLDLANGGAIFFDRIERVSQNLREKLFKALTGERKASRSGKTTPFDTRFMMSFNPADLSGNNHVAELKEAFKGNLIEISPLRERKKDIPELVDRFVDQFCDESGKHVESVSHEAMKALINGLWPENIGQLKEVICQGVMACDGPVLKIEHFEPIESFSETGARAVNGRLCHDPKTKNNTPPDNQPSKKPLRGKTHGRRHRTLKNSVVMCGQGLHSGIKTGLILSPLPLGSGIIFEDISTGRRVPATLENVKHAEYATTLSDGLVTIKTVEHIMSALHSYGITNLLIRIGDEAPIMDGSAIEFCSLIENSGIEEQDETVEEIVINTRLEVGDPQYGSSLRVEPSDRFSINFKLDYPPPIGKQEQSYEFKSSENYKKQIAPARTFGLLSEIKKLEEIGLASGGKLSNFILIDGEKVLNTPLRFPDEPVRHKILDLIGDLYLLGRPVRGHFVARKSGHSQNIALVRKITENLSV